LIRSDFEKAILSGALPPGARLPTELDLMERYRCSRMTVNKALSTLVTAGLIDRRKRAGTFVARPRVHSMVLDVPDLAMQVSERGQSYAYRPLLRKMRGPDIDRPEEEALAGGGQLLQIDGVHLADDVPLAVEYRLVSLSAVPDIAEADFEVVSPGAWLLSHVPWTEAETRISAVAALDQTARLLGVTTGDPCLRVERRTWRGTERVTQVQQIFVGGAYDLVARFGPGASGKAE